MSKGRFVAKPPFTVVVFDQWDHDCPGWELAVRENLEEAIVIAKEFNDNGIMKAGGVEKWLGFTDGALVYDSNNALAFNGIEDARVRHGYKGLKFFSRGKEGKEVGTEEKMIERTEKEADMGIIENALGIALRVHCGQKDKAGKEYILHPLRVMAKMETDEERAVAILHDVIEDSRKLPAKRRYTAERLLEEGIPKDVVEAVKALTKPEEMPDDDEAYFNFVRGAKKNGIARKVKQGDLEDNMDLGRIENPTRKDHDRLRKYEAALKILKEKSQRP